MTLRDFLGLAPQRTFGLDVAERNIIVDKLITRMGQEEEGDFVVAFPEESEQWTAFEAIGYFDHERLAQDQDAALFAEVVVASEESTITLHARHLEDLNISTSHGLLRVSEPASCEHIELVVENGWPEVAEDALQGLTELEAVEQLFPLLQQFLCTLADVSEVIQVIRAPQAPILWMYDPQHACIMLNPNLLPLFDYREDNRRRQAQDLVVVQQGLNVDSLIEECVVSQAERCTTCTEGPYACSPLFYGNDPIEECVELSENNYEGLRLYCVSSLTYNVEDCLAVADSQDRCGAGDYGTLDMEDLYDLKPFLTDPVCKAYLKQCLESGTPTEPSDPVVEPRYDYDEDDDWLADCCGSTDVWADLECSDDSSGDSGCEGDDSGTDDGCEGDDSSEDTECGGDDGGCSGDDVSESVSESHLILFVAPLLLARLMRRKKD